MATQQTTRNTVGTDDDFWVGKIAHECNGPPEQPNHIPPPPAPETANAADGQPVAVVATQPATACYSVPGCNLATLTARIAKLNKRCRRLGIPEIVVRVEVDYVAHEYRRNECRLGCEDAMGATPRGFWVAAVDVATLPATAGVPTGRVMNWYEVRVTGTAPKYDGWHFVATLEPLATDGGTYNLILAVPGQTCPGEYVKRVGVCDHCKTNRRRKQTFVVKHENGDVRAVGRSCLRDFLGHANPQTLAAWAEMLAELGSVANAATDEDWCGMGGGAPTEWDLEFYLGHVAAAVRVWGWCGRGRARDSWGKLVATVDTVNTILDPPKYTREDEKAEHRAMVEAGQPTADDYTTAAACVAWATGLDLDELATADNDYLLNVAIVARSGVVSARTCGLGGSIVAAHKRAMDAEINAMERARVRGPGAHIGTIKKRAVFTLTVKEIFAVDGMYGRTLIHKMVDADDNDVVWFCTGDSDFEEGQTYNVKATPKTHGEYNGRPQTTVNRVAEIKSKK